MKSIGLKDYLKMATARGIRLPIKYFLENHLFDLVNKTDTHRWLPKEEYKQDIENLEHGVLYMSSWTSVIKVSTKIAFDIIKVKDSFDLIDIGSGKGKTLLVWSKMKILCDQDFFYGVEYSNELVKVSNKNLKKLKKTNIVNIFNSDVTKIDLDNFKNNLLLYLYNPFNEIVMRKFLEHFRSKKIVLIYNNPIHHDIFSEFGYKLIHTKISWHPNGCFNIYQSPNF